MFIELTLANDSNVLINIDSIASIQPYDEKESEELMDDASVQEAISDLGDLFGQTISNKIKDIMDLTKSTKSIITILVLKTRRLRIFLLKKLMMK